MIRYFCGVDAYRTEQAIRQLAASLPANIRWVDPDEANTKPLAHYLADTQGLFSRTLIVFRDVSKYPAAAQKQLMELHKTALENQCIFWDRQPPDKRSSLWKSSKAGLQEFPALPAPQQVAWLQEVAKNQGGAIEPAAAQLLLARLGPNGWRLKTELERLLLRGPLVTKDMVAEEVPAPVEAEIFATIEAIAAGQREQALRRVTDLLASGQNEMYLLSMLAYQFRTLYLVKTGQAAAAKVHPYVIEKSQRLTHRFTAPQLMDILTKILATDVSIKQGIMDPRTGVTMLVLSLLSANAS